MALSKAEVCRAFREVMAADYADVPAREEIDHVFSPEFYAKMTALIAEQKRGSWRLLSRQRRRALVVAAILAVSMLLVACTPKLREAVSELVVTVYETFVRFTSDSDGNQLRTEIETVYEFNPVPEGFELESQVQEDPYCVETNYVSDSGARIVLYQFASTFSVGTTDAEHPSLRSKTLFETNVWFSFDNNMQTATFLYDGYQFTIRYFGKTTQAEFEGLVESLLMTNST